MFMDITQILNSIVSQQGGNRYPTKEEILAADPKHKAAVIAYIKEWKMNNWKEVKRSDNHELKFHALKSLLINVATEFYRKPVEVEYNAEAFSCSYSPAENKIILNQSLSILSSLHELAHHLFGASEKKACIWSVHLFRKTFPTAYKRLEWKGHMLVRPNLSSQ